jgi:hypothetical protein
VLHTRCFLGYSFKLNRVNKSKLPYTPNQTQAMTMIAMKIKLEERSLSTIKASDSLKLKTRNRMSGSRTRKKRPILLKKRRNSMRKQEKLRKLRLRSRNKEFYKSSKIRK